MKQSHTRKSPAAFASALLLALVLLLSPFSVFAVEQEPATGGAGSIAQEDTSPPEEAVAEPADPPVDTLPGEEPEEEAGQEPPVETEAGQEAQPPQTGEQTPGEEEKPPAPSEETGEEGAKAVPPTQVKEEEEEPEAGGENERQETEILSRLGRMASFGAPVGFGAYDAVISDVDTWQKLADAVAAANDNEATLIEISGDISFGTQEIRVDAGTKNITVASQGVGNTYTLAMPGNPTPPFVRHFDINAATSLTLRNIILDGANSMGGVRTLGNLTLLNTTIRNCKTEENGGGIEALGENSHLLIEGSLVENCVGGRSGGGVYSYDLEAIGINNSTVKNCVAITGAGLNLENTRFNPTSITITASDISNNHITEEDQSGNINAAKCHGGALFALNSTVVMDYVTVENNAAPKAALAFYNCGVTIANSQINGNNDDNYPSSLMLDHVGGLYGYEVDLTIENCGFSNNRAYGSGGALYLFAAEIPGNRHTLAIKNSTITGNTALNGGGMATYGMDIEMDDSEISGNTALDSGGGMILGGGYFSGHASAMVMRNSKLNNNQSQFTGDNSVISGGGAVILGTGASLTTSNSEIKNNTSGSYGGAIYAYGRNPIHIESSEVSGNTALYDGGALCMWEYDLLTVKDSGFSENVSGEGPHSFAPDAYLESVHAANIINLTSLSEPFGWDTSPGADQSMNKIYNNHDVRYVTGTRLSLHTVSFDPANTQPGWTEQVWSYKAVEEPAEPVWEGYVFDGWSADGGASRWDFSTIVDRDLSLTAQWKQLHTVHFNSNGGSQVADITKVLDGSTIAPPTPPTKALNGFGGWYRDAALTTPWDFDSDTVTSTLTLHAAWNPNLYSMHFDSNGGSPVDSIANIAAGSLVKQPANPTRTGHSFAGWYTAKGSKWNFDKMAMPDEDVLLTARWTASTYSVTYVHNNGTGATTVAQTAFGETLRGAPSPSRVGHGFIGWYTDSGELWVFEGANAMTMPAKDLTLTARWRATVYNVFFAYNNGTGSKSSDKAAYGALVSSPQQPTYPGHRFTGWFAANGAAWDFAKDTMPAQDLTLTAGWEPEEGPASITPPTPDTSRGEPAPPPSSTPTPTTSAPAVASSTSSVSAASAPSTSAGTAAPSSSAPAGASGTDSGTNQGGQQQESTTPPPADTAPESQKLTMLEDGRVLDHNPDSPNYVQDNGTINFFDTEVPLGGFTSRGGWSLVSLILGVLALLSGVVQLAWMLAKKKTRTLRRLLGILSGALPLLLFLVLENKAQMLLFSRWTPLVAAVFVAHAVALLVAVVHNRREEENDEADSETV